MKPSTDSSCCSGSDALADKFAALAHPARLDILLQLAGGPHCCKQVVERFDLAQSTVSQHLKVLVEAGLVRQSAQAQRSLYEIDRDAFGDVAAAFANLAARCRAPAEQEHRDHG